MKKFDLTLYLISDSTDKKEEEFLAAIEQSCEGGVTLVQLREKEKSDLECFNLGKKVKIITDKFNIPLIIDDRIDIAMAIGADGVHLGQNDIPIDVARKILGKDKIIGATAKTLEQGRVAAINGADYLGVGAIYPTTTKVVTVITSVSTLNEISSEIKLPVVAIGGLNSGNLQILYGSRATGIAVVSAIMKSSNPRKTAEDLKIQVIKNIQKHTH